MYLLADNFAGIVKNALAVNIDVMFKVYPQIAHIPVVRIIVWLDWKGNYDKTM